jgi:hypothetical protein
VRYDDVDFQSDKFGSDFSEAFVAPLAIPILDPDSLALDPAVLAQSLNERCDPLTSTRSCTRA